MIRRVAAVFVALVLVSCADLPRSVNDTSKIKTIAIVTAVSDTFSLYYNEEVPIKGEGVEDVPVKWGIRQRLENRLSSILGKYYQIRTLDRDPTPILTGVARKYRHDPWAHEGNAIAGAVKENIRKGQVDAVIVCADHAGAFYKYTSGWSRDYPYYLGVDYSIYVFDGATLDLIGSASSSVYRKRVVPVGEYDMPTIDIDLGWRGKPYSEISAAKKTFLREGVYRLIDISVPFTLRERLHLIP